MARPAHPWLAQIIESRQVSALIEHLKLAKRVTARGSRGSSSTIVAAALALQMRRPVLLVLAHLDEVDDALDDLDLLGSAGHELDIERFGALEVLPGESGVNLQLLAERLNLVNRLIDHSCPQMIVAPIQALMQSVPPPEAIGSASITFRCGDVLPPGKLTRWLSAAGYERQDAIEQPGDFTVRGGILDIYASAGTLERSAAGPRGWVERELIGPIRLDYLGDQIESISLIDTATMGSTRRVACAQIIGTAAEQILSDEQAMNLIDLLPEETIAVLHEVMELAEQARGYYERLTNPSGIHAPTTVFRSLTQRPHVNMNQYSSRDDDGPAVEMPVAQIISFDTEAHKAVQELAELARQGQHRVVVLCQKAAQRDRLLELIREHAPGDEDAVSLEVGYLHRGFGWGTEPVPSACQEPKQTAEEDHKPDSCAARTTPTAGQLIVVPHHELFHRYEVRSRIRRITAGAEAGDAFMDLQVGDYVVHVDYGIARFTGLKTMRRGRQTQEYLTLEFAERALLHVPATQIDLVQKYVGGFAGTPPLSALGGRKWSRQKQQVTEAVKSLAAELLRVQAARASKPGIRYPADTVWQREFEAEFPYEETDDQLAAVASVKNDMSQDRPMDRLICGDVGFGKTEVAIRASFKTAEYGKQTAVLVPTTVLAEQHERTFRQRMADYPFRIESLSRFKTGTEQAKLLEAMAAGRIDIIIGTHRLLSADIKFADLGLVVVDEEQRFGVEHKQRLLEFCLTADVLTLTATPIPRTLHMSLIGLRDISSLSLAPADRRAIVTEVIPFDENRIKQALIRELAREGQIFFVHNRIYDIQTIADRINQLVPDARVLIGHGQMPARALERVMLAFIRHQADVLVSTTIIESGIDIPNANTIFIHQADHFGLADLHQLRGRVGRYKHRAYCYLLLPKDRPITERSVKRLKAIEQYSMLGAGFKIAMRDLEIRGAGNLLGTEQSGHIAAVGYEMYCMLLEQEAKKLRNEPIIKSAKTHLELPLVPGGPGLPKAYISSDKHRMEAYRRLGRASTLEELEAVVQSMKDAYGDPPLAAQTQINLTEIRIAASTLGIDRIKVEGPDLIFNTRQAARLDKVFADAPGRISIIDNTTLYYRPPPNYLDPPSTLLALLRHMLVNTVRQQHRPREALPA